MGSQQHGDRGRICGHPSTVLVVSPGDGEILKRVLPQKADLSSIPRCTQDACGSTRFHTAPQQRRRRSGVFDLSHHVRRIAESQPGAALTPKTSHCIGHDPTGAPLDPDFHD